MTAGCRVSDIALEEDDRTLESPESGGSAGMALAGGDGGLQEYPATSETLILGPGERADTSGLGCG
jgi:hypothetical protein